MVIACSPSISRRTYVSSTSTQKDFTFNLGQHVCARLHTAYGARGTCELAGVVDPLIVVSRYHNVDGAPLYALCSEPIAAEDTMQRIRLANAPLRIFYTAGVCEDAMTAIEGSSELHQDLEAFMRSLEPAEAAMIVVTIPPVLYEFCRAQANAVAEALDAGTAV